MKKVKNEKHALSLSLSPFTTFRFRLCLCGLSVARQWERDTRREKERGFCMRIFSPIVFSRMARNCTESKREREKSSKKKRARPSFFSSLFFPCFFFQANPRLRIYSTFFPKYGVEIALRRSKMILSVVFVGRRWRKDGHFERGEGAWRFQFPEKEGRGSWSGSTQNRERAEEKIQRECI